MRFVSKSFVPMILVFASRVAFANPTVQINSHLSLLANNGTCELSWIESEDLRRTHTLSETNSNYFVAAPCAQWGLNLTWAIFFVTSGNNDSLLVRHISFVTNSPRVGITSSQVVSNYVWENDTLTLTSRHFGNSSQTCGVISGHRWNPQLQQFELLGVIKNDDCGPNSTEWQSLDLNWTQLD